MDDSSSDEQLRTAAADPGTPQATLADLAYDHAELRATIAANPSTYQGLLDWLRELGDPAVDAALVQRENPSAVAADSPVVAASPVVGAAAPPTDKLPVEVPTAPQSSGGIRSLIWRRPATVFGSAAGLVAAILLVVLIVSVVNTTSAMLASSVPTVAHHHHKRASVADPEPTPVATPTPTETPTPVVVPPTGFISLLYSYGWREGFSAPGGYTEQATVSIGNPEKVGTSYPTEVSNGTCETYEPTDASTCQTYETEPFKGGKYCNANAQTDAVVPINIDLTNTTRKFKHIAGATFSFNYDSYNSSSDGYLGMVRTLQWEGVYSGSGPQCETAESGNFFSNDSLTDGGGVQLQMFLIVPNYYTPDHPSGEAALLHEISMSISGFSNDGTTWTGDGSLIQYQNAQSAVSSLPVSSSLTFGGS